MEKSGSIKVFTNRQLGAYCICLYIGTRPDVSYSVSDVARFCSDLARRHWTAIKGILRYLKGTTDLGLLSGDGQACYGYSDSGDVDERRST